MLLLYSTLHIDNTQLHKRRLSIIYYTVYSTLYNVMMIMMMILTQMQCTVLYCECERVKVGIEIITMLLIPPV